MAISKAVISLVAVGMFGVAIAQEETRVKIEVLSDDVSHQAVKIDLDSADIGFNLHDMQEGENQAVVDENGRTILVTRHADGFTFDVDGKTIKMPLIDEDHAATIAMHAEHGELHEGVEVHVVHDVVEIEGSHDERREVKVVKKVEVISD